MSVDKLKSKHIKHYLATSHSYIKPLYVRELDNIFY